MDNYDSFSKIYKLLEELKHWNLFFFFILNNLFLCALVEKAFKRISLIFHFKHNQSDGVVSTIGAWGMIGPTRFAYIASMAFFVISTKLVPLISHMF